MNLQEQISRIKKVISHLVESKDEYFINKKYEISNQYNPDVEKLQRFLVYDKNMDLGSYDPNKDGVDGKYGRRTKLAHESFLSGTPIENTNISGDVLFVGGLESNMGLNGQTKLLQKGLGGNVNIKSFHHNDSSDIINDYINKNKPSLIFLFSAGANKISSISRNGNVNLNKVYIIEPYSTSNNVVNIINSAIGKGLPSKNVFHGGTSGRGSRIKGATYSNANNHFSALTTVPKII
jgi:hypothetical protein